MKDKIIELLKQYEDTHTQGVYRCDYDELADEVVKLFCQPAVMHRCKLVNYGDEEKRCVKCGYITWNNDKTDNEIIEDMIKVGYDVPDCDNGA